MLKYFAILAGSIISANVVLADRLMFPALYDVNGVASDDVLNVRDGAGASNPIINTLGPNERNVEIVKVSNDERWGLVSFPEASGWVSMRYLKRQSSQDSSELPKPLNCGGNEPFWGLQIHPSNIQFSEPGEVSHSFMQVWEDTPIGMQPISYALKMQGDGEDITAIVSRTLCSDGMSDSVYGFGIDVIYSGSSNNRYLTGCCSLDGR